MRRIKDFVWLMRYRLARRLLKGTGFAALEISSLQRAGQEIHAGLAVDAGRGVMRRHFEAAQRALIVSVMAGVE